ncbi:SGNH/GDSL hydrolase family protein [Leptolyngbyaceae cyanobacterium CCMR0082]|uniref:SGNH/GDSL hydrolase family protein n=2 Tax=Adonisia turfae TaxID=2950184 RepID=A0A6M0S1N8_9CYAN|nr:GDSL-type esterase/lipase family protein [Adonisia turfae]MDV3353370.1 GDSL-type esterase/lipase family protein [Leptothoe sp. LEGE 181152]NEZ60643.1 SGNH/GDSL hydrolase family protein [Adonisia turfae CCMR0081]NEZ62286.1 SGNH/GDSL hydrolase family protein [Adonisia turfae CCMR0082]
MKMVKVSSLLLYLGIPLVGASVALNFFLYGQLTKYYVELNQVRLDPLGLSYYKPNSNLNDKGDNKRVIIFGDSRAADWPTPQIKGYEFVNRGVGGQTSAQTSQRFDFHLGDLEPDIVVIQVGINDLKAIPLMPDERNVIIDLCRANIRQITEDAKALGATVIISTILPVGEVPLVRKPVWSDDIAQAIYEVNGYIDSLQSDKVLVFDGFSAIADEKGMIPKDFGKDELHLNAQGYTVLNEAFSEFFDTATFPNNTEIAEADNI